MSKSRIACEMSIESLLRGRKWAYLWTFTVAEEKLDPRETARRWNRCQRKLVLELGFIGVRVFEMHPGGHGLHVHLVTPFRYWVGAVRKVTKRYLFGRINVKPIPAICGDYVAKYLTKQTLQDFPELKGLRLWAKIGTKLSSWKGTKVNDIFTESEALDLFRRWYKLASLEQVENFHFIRQLMDGARLVSAGVCVPDVSPCLDGGAVFTFTFIHPLTFAPLPRPCFTVTGAHGHNAKKPASRGFVAD